MVAPNAKAENSNSCAELEQFFELAVDLLSVIDADGTFQRVNPAFEDTLGWTSGELLTSTFLDLVHPEDLQKAQIELEKLAHQATESLFECRFRCRNNSYRWLAWHIRSSRGEGLYAIAHDITEQKWTEASLKENEVKFRTLFERSPDAILLLDGQKFIDCNPAALEMMRCSTKDELLDLHPSELSPERQPDDSLSAEKADEMMAKAFELGSWRFEWVHRRTDGQDFPVEVTLTTVPLGGRQILYTEWRDITRRKRAQAELQSSEDALRTIFNSVHDAIFLHELDGSVIDVNDKMLEMYGVDREQAFNLSIAEDYSSPDNPLEELPRIWEKVVAGEDQLFEWIARRPGDGSFFKAEVFLTRIHLRDREVILATVSDITERKRAEEAIRQSQQRLSLTVQQTPLAVIEWNRNFEVEDWNPAAEKIFGYSKEEALGQHVAGLIVPGEIKEVIDGVMQDLVKQRGGTRNTNENITKDGRTIVCEWYNTPLINDVGEVIGVTSLAQDITERVRLEQAIQESLDRRERQVALSTEVAQEVALAPALDELFGQVVELVQERFDYYHAHVYTLEEEDLVMQEGTGEAGRQMKADGHKISLSAEQSLVARAARSGESVLAPDVSKEPGWLPNPLLPETKAEIAVPIKLGDQVLGVLDVQDEEIGALSEEDQLLLVGLCGQIAVAIDNRQAEIERKQVQEALQESERRFRSLVSNIPGTIYRCALDANWTMEFMTGPIEELSGYPISDFIGNRVRAYASIIHPEDTAMVDQKVQEGVTEKRPFVMEYRIIRADGQIKWVYKGGQAVYGEDGEPLWLDGAIFDITERKQAEEMLAKQAADLETVAQVSTETAGVLNPTEMLQTVVDLAKEGFELYHAHIYLLDDSGNDLDLAAGAGEVGRQMVAEGWRIPLDRKHSLVAQAAQTGQGVIANNVQEEPDFMPNPLLPDTRSELAVPIILEGRVLGVLDVQADVPNRFTQEDVRIKTTLAAQVAVALQNARLFERSEQALQELDALTRRLTREGWEDYLSEQPTSKLGYVYDLQHLTPLDQADRFEPEAAAATLAQSLTVQGEPVGLLELAEPQTLADEAADIVRAVAERLSGHLENLRLAEQSQRALAETELLYNVSRRLNEANDLQGIVGAAVEELNLPAINRAVLMLFDYDAEGEVETVTVQANWHSGQGTQPTPVGTQYTQEMLKPVFKELLRTEPLFVDETSDATAKQQNIRSMAVLPLWIGARQLGVFLLESEVRHHFTEQEMRPATSLAQQMAVAVQNQRLFEQTQATLAEQEKLVALIENSSDFISLATPEGEVVYLNEAGRRLVGLDSVEEVKGTRVADYAPQEDLPIAQTTVMPAIEKQGRWEGETRFQHFKTGAIIDVHMNTFLVKDPETGAPISLASVARDITERKVAEEALRESQVQLSEALNIARLGNWEIDIESQRFTFTDQLYAIYGTTVEKEGGYVMSVEQVGQRFFHPEDAHLVAAEIQKALETDDPHYSNQLEYRGPARPGEGQTYYLARFRIEKDDQGRTVKIIGATQDITEQKQAELERERLLAEVEAAYRQYVRQEWEQFLGERHQGDLRIEHQRTDLAVEPALSKSLMGAQEEVIREGKTKTVAGTRINGHETEAAVVAPITLRGQIIGTLSLQDIDPDRRWTDEEVALLETVSEQLALTVENLRLFDDTQERARREQITRQITDKMRAAADVDSIIQTGLTELARALGVSRSYVKLGSEPDQVAASSAEIEAIRAKLKPNGHSKKLPAATSSPPPGDGAEDQNQVEENN